jgi:uncharacterized protein (TIGR02646 family)
MIHIKRSHVKAPSILKSPKAAHALKRAGANFQGMIKSKAPGRQTLASHDPTIYGSREVKERLAELFNNKCSFCEMSFGSALPLVVEHFRPKTRAMQIDGTVSEIHYWWLAYEWENLYSICMDCNRMKATRFPTLKPRAEYPARGKALLKEKPLLLDPCVDNPERHIVFTADGLAVGKNLRGRVTIEVFGLNRINLVSERKRVVIETEDRFHSLKAMMTRLNKAPKDVALTDQVKNLLARVKSSLEDSQPYAAVRRQVSRRWMEELGLASGKSSVSRLKVGRETIMQAAALSPLVTKEEEEQARASDAAVKQEKAAYSVEAEDLPQQEVYFTGSKRIERIVIRNFKSIRQLTLDFPHSASTAESWMMFLGDNGTGKSSILQATALALMGQQHVNNLGLNASDFVRRGGELRSPRAGSVEVYLTNVGPIRLDFKRGNPQFTVTPEEPKVLLLGYGATRLLPRHDHNADADSKYIRIKNLFDPRAPLNDAEAWLVDEERLSTDDFGRVKNALKDLLLLGEKDDFVREDGHINANVNGNTLPLQFLSDGLQSMLALSTDVMISLLEKWKSSEISEAEAIVLLDEIEVHLHPRWKLEIVQRLRRCFPRLAFLVTTHDPLCLKGLNDGEIIVLRRDEEQRIVALTDVPSVNDLRADQILTSFMFDLPTTRGDEAVKKIARYSKLLGKRRKTSTERAELARLKSELSSTLNVHSSPTQQLVEKAVRTTLRKIDPPATTKKLVEKSGSGAARLSSAHLPDDVKMEIKRQLKKLLS